MTLTHGADADRLRQIADALQEQGARATRLRDEGSAGIVVLQQAWHGADLVEFTRGWRGAEQTLETCAERLGTMARLMTEEAEEQVAASEGGTAPFGPGGGSPPGPPGGPREVPHPPLESTFDEEVRGTEGQPVDKDLWYLAYRAQGTEHPLHEEPVIGYELPPVPEGYEAVGDDELRAIGLDPGTFGPDAQPQASIFRTPDGGYVVAFQGSVEGADWAANVDQALGERNPQYTAAMELGQRVTEATGGDVTFTGHSLGGGLASAAGLATGQPAVTFDSSGVHENTAAQAAQMRGGGATGESVLAEADEGQMRSYSTSTDGVTNVQEATPLPDAPGTSITLGTPPSAERTAVAGAGAGVGALVGGAIGVFDGNPFDMGRDVAGGAAVGVAVAEGAWGHHWDPMTDALEDRYPD